VGISFGGLSSGLPPNIVDQLVEAEKAPIKNLENRKTKDEAKMKLVSDLETKVTAIQGTIGTLASSRGFTDIKLISGDPNILQGTVDPERSVNGSWNIEVLEIPQKAAALTNGFPDKDKTEIGVGYFKFDTPEGKKEVYISGANSTLDGAAQAINQANLGVKAGVINDRRDPDAPFKLMISGSGLGDENQISFPTLYFLDGDQDLYFDEKKASKNGLIKVDGIEFEINDTNVKDIIPGVNLDIKQSAPGRQVNVSVKENQEVVAGKVKEVVTSVNAVLSFIQQQNTLKKESDTTSTLGGDVLLRSVEQRFRSLIQNPQYGLSTEINRLNQLGITFNRSGVLDFDEKKFNAELAKNPGGVQRFLAGDGFQTGFIPSLKREINSLVNTAFGPISNRKRGLQTKIEEANKNIENKTRQLAKREETLRNKFARLEETMSRLKGQGAAIGGISQIGGGGGGPAQGAGGQ
jgi:flagellar hook-associated protein 2